MTGAFSSIFMRLHVVFLSLAMCGTAFSTPWTIRENLIPETTKARLAERYPNIRNASDLESLLRDVARRHPLSRLDATLVNGIWVISGKTALTIHDIQIETTTRLLRKPLYASLTQYIGQVDAPEIRSKLIMAATQYMKRRGYPEALVEVTAQPTDDGIAYRLKVIEGAPCVISSVEMEFTLPPKIKLDITPGSICDVEALEEATIDLESNLKDLGFNQLKIQLDSLQYDFENDTAKVRIQGILGQRIRYEIVDQTKKFLIDDLFADEELTKIDPTIVGPDAMGAELARRYRQRGYIDVNIRGPEVKKTSDSEYVYTYFVDPGSQYTLKEVKFEGVSAFQESEILDIMKLRTFWQTSRPANYEEIQAGITALKAEYQKKGYWDVQIQDPGLGQKDKDSGTIRLVIQVEEGAKRVLGTVKTSGNTQISHATIENFLETNTGEALARAKLVDIQQQIRAGYMALGYLYNENKIDLKARQDQREIVVDVDITIEEGTRVTIGDIIVTGLTRTNERVVRRELVIQEGDWYEPEKITASRQAITNLGIFRSVQIGPTDRNALALREKKIDLLIEVQEGRAGNVTFGPGWSVAKGFNYVAEASYNNLGGVGRAASIRGVISEEIDQYAIGNKTLVGRRVGAGYTEPFILNYPVDGRIKLNHRAEWSGELWALRYGGELEVLHRLRLLLPRSSISTFYSQEIAKSEGSSIKESQLIASDVRIAAIGTRFNLDRRRNPQFPTGGFALDSELAWARYELGGDLRYFKWDITSNYFFELYSNIVLAMGINLSSFDDIARKGETIGILPPSERFYAGGADTVRGYKPRALGPIVIGPTYTVDPVTGKCQSTSTTTRLDGSSRTTIKTELRYKWDEDLAVSAFTDNGNVFFSRDQIGKFEASYDDLSGVPEACRGEAKKNKIYDNFSYSYDDLLRNPKLLWDKNFYAYGIAFNRLTPIGSINFAYGLPWKEPRSLECRQDPGECHPRATTKGHWLTRGEFHINVGAQF